MAGANFSTVAAALMNDRTDKMIHNLLQNDVAVWAKLPVKKRTWQGDVSIITCRVERNGSVVSVLGSTEPIPGQKGFLRYTIQAKRVLGRFQIDEFTVLSADSSAGSVAVEPADEMNGLLDDVQRQMTRYTFLGGGGLQGISSLTPAGSMIGVVWQHSNAITTYGYRGRFDDIVAQAQAVNFIQFIRLDTYAVVNAVPQLLTDLTSRTIVVAANIDTSTLPAGVPVGVMLVGAASQAFVKTRVSGDNTAGNPCAFAVAPAGVEVGALIGDMTGLVSNLTQPLHFGNDRASTAAGIARIRANFSIVNNNNAQGGDTLDSISFTKLHSRIRTTSGKRLDAWWMSFEQQTALVASLIGTADANVRVSPQVAPGKFDAQPQAADGNDNFDSHTQVGGTPIYCSDLCPDGMAIGMHYDSWERLFKGKMEGQWVGANGPGTSPLAKLQGETMWGATRSMYPEQIITYPKAGGLLVGIADA